MAARRTVQAQTLADRFQVARVNARDFREGLEFRKKVWFWLIVILNAIVIWFALTSGNAMFNSRFGVDPNGTLAHEAGPSLAVLGMSLVAAGFSLVNVFRKHPIRFEIPRSLERVLPVIAAILVGLLIGKTIFT